MQQLPHHRWLDAVVLAARASIFKHDHRMIALDGPHGAAEHLILGALDVDLNERNGRAGRHEVIEPLDGHRDEAGPFVIRRIFLTLEAASRRAVERLGESGRARLFTECTLDHAHLREALAQSVRVGRLRFDGDVRTARRNLDHGLGQLALEGADVYPIGIRRHDPAHDGHRLLVVSRVLAILRRGRHRREGQERGQQGEHAPWACGRGECRHGDNLGRACAVRNSATACGATACGAVWLAPRALRVRARSARSRGQVPSDAQRPRGCGHSRRLPARARAPRHGRARRPDRRSG